MNGYITVQEAAEKWGVTPRQVQILCKENRIVGAMRMSRIWIIPENAQKPTNTKRTSNKTGGKKFAATHSVIKNKISTCPPRLGQCMNSLPEAV